MFKFFKNIFKSKKKPYTSETSKIRHLVIDYCNGIGCDIGFGGDKIKKVNCIGIDYAQPYAYTGEDKVDIACDLFNENIPVANDTYDYVYSSHLIEDFVDTKKTLIEFIRILKSDGNLVLVFPNQKLYEKHCIATDQPLNPHHIHTEMSLQFMFKKLSEIENISVNTLFSSDCEIDYNVVMVCTITKH